MLIFTVNILLLSAFWILVKLIKSPDNNTPYYTILPGLSILLGFTSVVHTVILKPRLNQGKIHLLINGIISGSLIFVIVVILTNVFVVVRPEWSDTGYLLELFFAFITGFILPYSENTLKRLFNKH